VGERDASGPRVHATASNGATHVAAIHLIGARLIGARLIYAS